ncbi:hypothetical protein BKA70DRAFT_1092259 [Coprinopsis sp. MPI-PUGE-AT-0042]|nr:hypothetical protein BKA70DRAFT_1092259 [Coprinopsis sp. MPI-PUGE-AT-0042]
MSTSIIKDFFDRFGDHFEYNEEEAANSNFYALCEWEDWKRDDPYREEVYAEFKRALVAEFNRKYGVDENDLFVWRLLCERVGILNIPWTVRECRRAIRNTYVNLVDLTEANEGDKVATFKSEQELAAYTRSTGKFFPANHAHAGGLPEYALTDLSSRQMSSAIKEFFDQFTDFEYRGWRSANANFYALCDYYEWKRGNPDREEAYREFKDALVEEFNRKYGQDDSDLDAWQTLCARVGMEEWDIPETVRDCRWAIRNTHVNLVDLTEAQEGDQVKTFETEEELAAYTRKTGKFFPADHAYAGGLLRKLLRRILTTRDEEQVHSSQKMPSSFIRAFFSQYPGFSYSSRETANKNFYRLCDERGWKRTKPPAPPNPFREAAHALFKDALVHEFNRKYGKDENDLEAWQTLCKRVGMKPIPEKLDECREAIRATHVNLVDLTEAEPGQTVQIFDTEEELAVYTITEGSYFPKESAYAGGLLRKLLRHILSSPTVGRGGGRGRGRARGRRY